MTNAWALSGFKTTSTLSEARQTRSLSLEASVASQQHVGHMLQTLTSVYRIPESAGSWSVDAMLTSYPAGSSPPFRGAIEESGVVSYLG